jgi:hypothetical protein
VGLAEVRQLAMRMCYGARIYVTGNGRVYPYTSVR